jgi:hypothetical protein
MKIRLIDDQYKVTGDRPMKIMLKSIVSGDIPEAEVKSDILKRFLRLEEYRNVGYSELKKAINEDFWYMNEVSEAALSDYLELKNAQLKTQEMNKVLKEVRMNRRYVESLNELLRTLSNEVLNIKNKLNVKNYVTIEEVADLFPGYSLNSIRNIVSRNRSWDKHLEMYISWLEIDRFKLRFSKREHQKRWYADRFDYIPEKAKTYDYDFRRILESRLKHA